MSISNKKSQARIYRDSSDPAFNKNMAYPIRGEIKDATKQLLDYLSKQTNLKQTLSNIALNTPEFLNAHIANTTEGPGRTTILHYSNGADVIIFTSDCINHKDDITSHDISYVLREYGLYLDLTTYPSYIY